jgi:hypothetical protein
VTIRHRKLSVAGDSLETKKCNSNFDSFADVLLI